MLFDERAWEAIEKRIAPEYLLDLKRQALEISLALPTKPTEGDVEAQHDLFEGMRSTIRSIRSFHAISESFPLGGESNLELALWAIGLSHFRHVRR